MVGQRIESMKSSLHILGDEHLLKIELDLFHEGSVIPLLHTDTYFFLGDWPTRLWQNSVLYYDERAGYFAYQPGRTRWGCHIH